MNEMLTARRQSAVTDDGEELLEARLSEELQKARRRRYRNAAIWAGFLFLVTLLFGLLAPAYSFRSPLAALSDAFMVPGLGLTALGLVRMAGYHGSLDIVGYFFMRQASLRSKDRDSVEEREKRRMTLSEYTEKRSQNRVFPSQDFALGLPLAVISLLLAVLATR